VRTKGYADSVEEMLAYADDIVDACKREQCRRVLLDERELRLQIGTFYDYLFAEGLSSRQVNRHLSWIACVPNERDKVQASFFEILSLNRGLNYRVFSSIEDAEKWLGDD
jgi:hypothetical protein